MTIARFRAQSLSGPLSGRRWWKWRWLRVKALKLGQFSCRQRTNSGCRLRALPDRWIIQDAETRYTRSFRSLLGFGRSLAMTAREQLGLHSPAKRRRSRAKRSTSGSSMAWG